MSLGKALMGMFIESAEAEQAQESKPGPESKVTSSKPREASTEVPSSSPRAVPEPKVVSGEADQTLIAALRKTILENNLPGFDYLEFEASLKALASVIPDEAIRFRSAFATAAVQGLTLETLTKTSQSYRELLTRERAQFEKDLQGKQETDVAKRKDEIEALAKDIQAKADQVKRLTDEITAAQQKQRNLETQAQKSQAALERARTRFLASLALVDDEIVHNQTLIKTYLTGA